MDTPSKPPSPGNLRWRDLRGAAALLVCLLTLTCPAWAKPADTGWLPLGQLESWSLPVLEALPEKILILGEVHGTEEAPRAALGLALSLKVRGRESVLAVEWPVELQESLDRGDLEALKSHPFFQAGDGRTSKAMVDMIVEALGLGIPVRCFDRTAPTPAQRELLTAETLLEIAREKPGATLVVLVGNYHSRLDSESSSPADYPSTAMNLVSSGASIATIRLTANKGEAWNISGGTRGPHPAGSPETSVSPPAFRRFTKATDSHHAALHLKQFTASPPWAEKLSDANSSDSPMADNPELAQMFTDDQAARQGDTSKIDWSKISAEDAARRERTRQLLDSGLIKTGKDFWHAAFIFQHGSQPDDYLLSHALACASMARGYEGGAWIAAASLDRYLQNVGQPQVYGTQYLRAKTGEWTSGDYNSTLLPDALRKVVGVPTLAEQKTRLEEMQKR